MAGTNPAALGVTTQSPFVENGQLKAQVYGTSVQGDLAHLLVFTSVSLPRLADGSVLDAPADLPPGESFVITSLDSLAASSLVGAGQAAEVPLTYKLLSNPAVEVPYTVLVDGTATPVVAVLEPLSEDAMNEIERIVSAPRLTDAASIIVRTEEITQANEMIQPGNELLPAQLSSITNAIATFGESRYGSSTASFLSDLETAQFSLLDNVAAKSLAFLIFSAVVEAVYEDRSSDGYTSSLAISGLVEGAPFVNLFSLAYKNGDSIAERIRTSALYSNSFSNGPYDIALASLLNQVQVLSPNLYVPDQTADTVYKQLVKGLPTGSASIGASGIQYSVQTTSSPDPKAALTLFNYSMNQALYTTRQLKMSALVSLAIDYQASSSPTGTTVAHVVVNTRAVGDGLDVGPVRSLYRYTLPLVSTGQSIATHTVQLGLLPANVDPIGQGSESLLAEIESGTNDMVESIQIVMEHGLAQSDFLLRDATLRLSDVLASGATVY